MSFFQTIDIWQCFVTSLVEIGQLVIENKIAKRHHEDGRDLYLNVGLHCATFVWKWQCDFGKGVKNMGRLQSENI
jgi:hypothetical protein